MVPPGGHQRRHQPIFLKNPTQRERERERERDRDRERERERNIGVYVYTLACVMLLNKIYFLSPTCRGNIHAFL